jgi:heme/copper-type cytochrome/quinol oxidase subunit 3
MLLVVVLACGEVLEFSVLFLIYFLLSRRLVADWERHKRLLAAGGEEVFPRQSLEHKIAVLRASAGSLGLAARVARYEAMQQELNALPRVLKYSDIVVAHEYSEPSR